jgi:hypothetical protein
MDVCAVRCKVALLFVQISTVLADHSFTVKHEAIKRQMPISVEVPEDDETVEE